MLDPSFWKVTILLYLLARTDAEFRVTTPITNATGTDQQELNATGTLPQDVDTTKTNSLKSDVTNPGRILIFQIYI